MGGVLEGILLLAAITVVFGAVVGGVLYAARVAAGARWIGRKLHVVPPPEPQPLGMPIERIAADLRRLRRDVSHPRWGLSMARRRGTLAAYDDALQDACRALEIETSLGEVHEGMLRDTERLRVEEELRRAGISMGDAA